MVIDSSGCQAIWFTCNKCSKATISTKWGETLEQENKVEKRKSGRRSNKKEFFGGRIGKMFENKKGWNGMVWRLGKHQIWKDKKNKKSKKKIETE